MAYISSLKYLEQVVCLCLSFAFPLIKNTSQLLLIETTKAQNHTLLHVNMKYKHLLINFVKFIVKHR